MNLSNQSEQNQPKALFTELSEAIRLREGASGISKCLWSLLQGRAHSTRTWSQAVHLPVPVLAALRRELEKRDLLETGSKLRLTLKGREVLSSLFDVLEIPNTRCTSCKGSGLIVPATVEPLIEEFIPIGDARPGVDVSLDQSHATPETAIRKALFLLEKGLINEPLFFLGDDDLISVACFLVRRHFVPENAAVGIISVADIDARYLEYIQEVTDNNVRVYEYDARNALPNDLLTSSTVALTDPAYTVDGITLFGYRCRCVVKDEGTMLLSMPLPDQRSLAQIEKNLLSMGWVIREIHPRFNEYFGASIHAHVSHLFVCESWSTPPPEGSIEVDYNLLYTADVRGKS